MKVVLLPGLDGTGALFKPFIEALANDIETLVVAYPPNLKLNYEALVEFVISHLPQEEFILVGESFSGPIAYMLALRKLENLKAVIFVATFLGNPRPFLLSLSRLLPISYILSRPIPGFIVNTFLFGMTENKQLISLFRHNIKQVSADVLSYRLREITHLTEAHQSCELKATYIQAMDDKLVPGKCVQNFKKIFNNIDILQIEGPHLILQTQSLACAEIIANEIRLISTRSTEKLKAL